MNIDYYQQQDYRFIEMITTLEKFYYTSEGKFFLNSMTPLLSDSSPKNDNKSKLSTSNILNYNSKLGVASFTLSNYIELSVPRYIGEDLKDINGYIAKGTKFLISFVGGDINKPRIVGVY